MLAYKKKFPRVTNDKKQNIMDLEWEIMHRFYNSSKPSKYDDKMFHSMQTFVSRFH